MVYPRLGEPLSMLQFDRLRALLFPEIRIRQIALPLDEPTVPDPSVIRQTDNAGIWALARTANQNLIAGI